MPEKNTDLLKMAKIIDETWEETRVLGLTPPPISTVKLLERVAQEARAEERKRIRKIVQNWDGECLSLHEINNGFVAIDRFKTVILGSLDKPLTNKE